MLSEKPLILAISLNRQPFFDKSYDTLLTQLKCKAQFERTEDPISTIQLLAKEPKPSAILITDEAPSLPEHALVWEACLRYMRHGGTAIIMGHFPCFVKPTSMEPFFAKAGLA